MRHVNGSVWEAGCGGVIAGVNVVSGEEIRGTALFCFVLFCFVLFLSLCFVVFCCV